MRILIFGPQGCGKGTQAELISKHFSIPHISTGALFRENIKNGTPLGQKAKALIDKGMLIQDDITNKLVKERLSKEDCRAGFILDGYPRTFEQLKYLLSYTSLTVALDIEVSDDESVERISGRKECKKCGRGYHINYRPPKVRDVCDSCGNELLHRADDEPEAIIKRLEIYHEQTKPIVAFLKEKGLIQIVNGSQSIEEVSKDILLLLKRDFSKI